MKHKSSAETDGTKVLDKLKLLEIMNVQDFIAIRLQSGAKQTLQSLSITVLAWLLKKRVISGFAKPSQGPDCSANWLNNQCILKEQLHCSILIFLFFFVFFGKTDSRPQLSCEEKGWTEWGKAVLTNCLLLFNYPERFRFALQERLHHEEEFITEEVMTSN